MVWIKGDADVGLFNLVDDMDLSECRSGDRYFGYVQVIGEVIRSNKGYCYVMNGLMSTRGSDFALGEVQKIPDIATVVSCHVVLSSEHLVLKRSRIAVE